MTKEDIIKLAREAGFTNPEKFTTTDENLQGILSDFWENLERFAALVAAAERAEIERLKLLCEEMLRELYVYRASEYLKDVTAAIRARGQA